MSPPTEDRSSGPPTSSPVDPSLLTLADVGVARITASGDIAAANEPFVNLTAYSHETLVGTPFKRVVATLPPALEGLLEGDAPDDDSITLTLPMENGAGELVACESVFRPLPADGEYGPGFVAILYPSADSADIRAVRPDRDEEIAPARAFVALADALSEGIIVLDAESRIQYANPAVERILGHAPDELVGGSKLEIIPERLREAHLNALNRYLETGRKNIDWEYVELPGQHRDGHEVPLGISLNDFFFDGDRYFVGLFRDISPRKEAERALREREQRLKRYKEYTDDVLDAIDDMFYVLDTAGNLKRWNRTLCDVTGYADDEIGSMHALDFFAEDERASIESTIEEGFETGHARVEAELLTAGGERIPYEFVASTLSDPDGNRVLAGIGRDVTRRREQRRKLEESNERLEQFAYAASHDLQEPLRMVTSYLQLLERRYGDALDEDGREFLAFAADGAERMREMIEGLLEYSRVDTGGEPTETVDLEAVLEEVTEDLRLKIEESNATVRDGDLPTVVGDRGQLRQVFQNLLSNAIEYTEDGSPTVEIAAERTGETWRIAVRDDGIGIDPVEADRVFEVFQRLHSRDEGSGTGLGLALCERIVERHGGRIWVESEPGEGSTFFFTLPDASSRN